MSSIPYIDIHTHPFHKEADTITVQNIFPGDGFAAFNGRNFYSVGLHPWHIGTKEENNEALQMVEEALEFDHVIFVGEAGLDKINGGDFIEQLRVFEAQAVIAEEYQYPLIIHCVKAMNEVMVLRAKMNPVMPWILHGYNGSLEQTKQLMDKGFLFSFGKSLFRDNAKAIESFKYLPLNKIFFETDEVDTSVEEVYKQAALLKDTTVEQLQAAVWNNFNQIENSLLPGKM
ncbi:TatD family hydrolase [Draconibacterium sp. IB214405]|uniref:TatD family hydrolase n=1 Tax=Draconibacterium sp. IB214405 TaxID=3097352 RepID=UPI002A0EF62B|nr:TatD family hydrolase [Draconibacterium sp. IB214405]MDX8339728.1 TatD family hydrolase [Draconibacterium sp. IB214405]